MARYSVTFIGIILMLVFGIFFGIELATRGMERIQGPVPGPFGYGSGGQAPYAAGQQPLPAPPAQQNAKSTAPVPQQPVPQPQPVPAPQPLASDSGINRVGNQIGDMLQMVAHNTIRTVVSLLDGIVN